MTVDKLGLAEFVVLLELGADGGRNAVLRVDGVDR